MKLKKVISIVMLSVIFLAGCSSKSQSENGELNIYNWGDYIDEDILNDFYKETGIKVNYDNFDSNETMYTKLKIGGSNYDLCIPSDYMIERMVNEDMLEKIDMNNIPNYSNIDEKFKNRDFDPNNEYSVPYMWGTVGILYNKDMVTEKVDNWDILWNEQYSGKIYMYDSVRDSFAVALKKLNYSLNSTNEEEIKEAADILLAQKPLVLAYYGDQIKEGMIKEEAALSVVYSGDAMYAISNNESLDYVIPKEGSNGWYDAMVIPKGAKNKKNAEIFIDYMCRPEVSAKNSEYTGFTTSNVKALEFLPDEMKSNPIYWPSDEEFNEKCEIFKDLGETIKIYDSNWTEILATE